MTVPGRSLAGLTGSEMGSKAGFCAESIRVTGTVGFLVAIELVFGLVLPDPVDGGVLTPGVVPAVGVDRPDPDAEAEADALLVLPLEFPEDLPLPVGLPLGFIF